MNEVDNCEAHSTQNGVLQLSKSLSKKGNLRFLLFLNNNRQTIGRKNKKGNDMSNNLRKSNFGKFLLLWSGELISSIGGGLTSFGLGVYVFGQTGSATGMALVTLLGFLPTLLLSVPAGVLADRYDRRLLMMLGDGCSALGIIYILI